MNDRSFSCDQIEDENIFTDETTDEALEAAASGPMVTFTLSMVLFACQFCPSDPAGHPTNPFPIVDPSAMCLETASLTGLDTTSYALPSGSATNRVASTIFTRIKI
jgi:hypothetical protein